jgi:hypothetical protein
MFVCIAQIPQRYITVNGLSPLAAAVRLLTYGAFVPFGSGIAGAMMGKPRIPPCWIILAGSLMEILGIALLAQIGTSSHIDASQYAFQIIAGTGTGLVNSGLIMLVPYAMEKRDLGELYATSQHEHVGVLRLLIVPSRRLSSYITVPYSGRSSRYRHCNIHFYALHSLPPDRYPSTGTCRKPARKDGVGAALVT